MTGLKGAEWHARIECGGTVSGAGFLVTPDKVLTCAHVIENSDLAPVTVTFPQRPGDAPVAARVVAHGGWDGRVSELGDLAVLELDREVPITPAPLAPADVAHGDRRLMAYGFPAGYDDGTIAEFRAVTELLIGGEWIQLEAWSGQGQPLAVGFSGAAVTLVDTGQVVGMVTAAAGARALRIGRMMPTHVLARYWSGLSDLVPVVGAGHVPGASVAGAGYVRGTAASGSGRARATPTQRPPLHGTHAPLPAHFLATPPGSAYPPGTPTPNLVHPGHPGHPGHPDGPRLRALVEKAARAGLDCDPVRLYAAAAGPFDPDPPAEGFGSLWSAAWFVLCDVDDPATVTRFVDRLDALLNAPPQAETGAILVELGHSGAGDDLVRVEVSAYSAGRRHPVPAQTVPRSRLRACVQDRIEDAFCHLTPGADELIAFALPRDWLDWPVDRWEKGPDDDTPLGCVHPVVVTDHARRRSSTRHVLTSAWQRLDTRTGAGVHRVTCGGVEDHRKLRLALLQSEVCLAGFGATSRAARTRPHFETSITAPAPVIVWSRQGCDPGEAECAGSSDCPGTAFLDALDDLVCRVPPAQLPRRVLSLRQRAEAEDDHWARDIQLLWDDPRRFTDPHTAAVHTRSPVA
ncbi:Trypsin-like peptidase domain-containing protein [Streptomyces sp. cf386]|uniref:VMAP-C domain-containing protein n=1 Tax=Streptomyces sp. cf386 TaxID=1761904 RepID=UPI0008889E82|nr:trypsin-like peptidase domain-containing protein [Streptomyces sp. cf386]SDO92340.1 Trypsin-like peptidase domain-containing protein [Streptomyces sp. cf386]